MKINSAMDPPSDDEEIGSLSSLKDIFTQCQGFSRNEPFILQLTKLMNEMVYRDFFKEFSTLLMHVFIHAGQEEPVSRIFELVVKFAKSLDNEHIKMLENLEDTDEEDAELHPFSEDLFTFLLKMQQAAYFVIRQRALLLMGRLFKELNELPTDGPLWKKLYSMASLRLKDTSVSVRAQAVLTYCYLQDPSSPNCPIIKEFLFMLSRDPGYAVRQNIANTIAVTSRTVIPLLTRLRDVNSSVRKTALLRVSERISVTCFSVAQRMDILSTCLNDLSNDVKLTLKQNLVPAWFKTCKNDPIAFIDMLDIQASPEMIQQVLNMVFESVDVRTIIQKLSLDPESHLIPLEQLTDVQAFLWSCLCHFIKDMEVPYAAELFDDLTPTVSELSDYLEVYFETLNSITDDIGRLKASFIFQQLLSLASELDYSDPFGMEKLRNILPKILKSNTCMLELIKPIVVCIRTVEGNYEKFLRDISEIVYEIYKPVMTGECDDHRDYLVRKKVLMILIEAYRITLPNEITSELIAMKEIIIIPNLAYENYKIHMLCIEALALHCMYSVNEAKLNYQYFMKAIIYGEQKVQATALQAAFDMLITFGCKLITALDQDENGNNGAVEIEEQQKELEVEPDLASFMEKFLPILDSPFKDVQFIGVQGLAKVMICQRISSSTLFSKLCLMRCHPANADDAKLQFCIAKFMSEYAETKTIKPSCFIESFMTIIETIFEAPPEDDLSKVDGVSVAATLLKLALLLPSDEENEREGNIIHDDLALRLCYKILADPEAQYVPELIRIFSHFTTTDHTPDDLLVSAVKILRGLRNKKCIKVMSKFVSKLKETKVSQREEVFLAPRQLSFSKKSMQSVSEMPIEDSPVNRNSNYRYAKCSIAGSPSEAGSESDQTQGDSSATVPQSESERNGSPAITIPESPEGELGKSCEDEVFLSSDNEPLSSPVNNEDLALPLPKTPTNGL